MSVLIASPFNLIQADIPKVRVSASNIIGAGLPSAVNSVGAAVRTIPNKMNNPTRGINTSTNRIQVNWIA